MSKVELSAHAFLLKSVISHHAQSVHYKIVNRVSDLKERDRLIQENSDVEKNFNMLVIKYGRSLEGLKGADIIPTDKELNAMNTVYHIYKRELKDEIEVFRQMGANESVINGIEKSIKQHLAWLTGFSTYMTNLS